MNHVVEKVGRCEPCGGNTITFKSKHSNKVYQIKKKIKCNSKIVTYLIECKVSKKQYNSSTVTKFCARANTIKAHMVILGKRKNCQTKSVTRNAITNIIWRKTITGFVTAWSDIIYDA